jgi:hypothetical protein
MLTGPDVTVFEVSRRMNLGDLPQSVEHLIQSLMNSGARMPAVDPTGQTSVDSGRPRLELLVSVFFRPGRLKTCNGWS